MSKLQALGFICCFHLALGPPALAQQSEQEALPSWWELGAGLALVSYPHYPGAEQSSTLLAPFPYPVYHSEHINLDEEGLVASVAERGRFSLKASLNGSLPVSDRDNRARAGMADLDLVAEAGPSVHISLFQDEQSEWRIEVPVRAAFRIGGDDELVSYSGWTTNPGLYYEARIGEWNWESSIGAIWSSRDYHGFFYDVEATDATLNRPFFEAHGGFTAARGSMTLKRRWGPFIGLGYMRYMNFTQAANQDSSLMRSNQYLAGGISLIYLFYSTK